MFGALGRQGTPVIALKGFLISEIILSDMLSRKSTKNEHPL